MRGGIKDFLIAMAIGCVADLLARILQHAVGGCEWLPDGPMSFGYFAGAYWFSRYPIWERR